MSNLSLLYDSLAQVQDPLERLELIRKVKDWIHKLDLFSSNERLEEISTGSLKFLSLPVKEAAALSELSFQKSLERIQVLETSSLLVKEFIDQITTLDSEFQIEFKGNTRDVAIQEFKREKELKEIISILEKRQDEEGIRDFLLQDLQLQVLYGQKILKTNTLELELLKNKENIVQEKPILSSNSILDKQGKVLRPFIITSSRKDVKDKVFRNSHNLPTMTIDEYLAKEFERGNFLKQDEVKESSDEDEDQKLEKERKWDEFKDDNPRGWGNRLNKS